ncbi:BON domain-containing protein [Sulfurirhabdus autotrophica]|uniref:Osmotically-inducible protein OsmY n=1 Tax=Sulfurirhabdus autotrophica TaxID=1706046 RepID=A0A4V2W162_9PROT|nr:BON domain-containing protein [Sulfurirhabdus autotrophica]TCV83039.1 osmotically-inducible protein OsmY [Sulfurirhabdus autotrophica]
MHYLKIAILVAILIPNLQGCFPLVAAGAGAGVLMAEDRRTGGIYLEDENIELKANSRISEHVKETSHIEVTSYNRNVLLTGETPTETLKQEIETIARGVPSVQSVTNEIVIARPSALSSRSNDAYITSKVKARFVDASRFRANYVKVVTENGTVFLLGLVKHQEAEDATEIARSTSGVLKVVKVFEYID